MALIENESPVLTGIITSFENLSTNDDHSEPPKSKSEKTTSNGSIPTGPAALKTPSKRRKSKINEKSSPEAVSLKSKRKQNKKNTKTNGSQEIPGGTDLTVSSIKQNNMLPKKESSESLDLEVRPQDSRPSTPTIISSDNLQKDQTCTPTTQSFQIFRETQVACSALPFRIPKKSMLANGINWLSNRSKVFVAIDLELFEFNNNYLTEIGIAVYDPTNMSKNQPNPILPKIKCCHFIVKENKHKVNGRFVPNNMYNFSYGESVIMSMNDCKAAVNTILFTLAKNNNMVIVGHGVDGDISVLKKEGFHVPKHQVLDTSTMWRMTRQKGFGSLEKLLEFFEIPHALMHNAGNDAFLSLCLYFALCDPEVRREKRLDEPQPEEEIQPADSSRKRKKLVPSAPLCVFPDEAIKLIIDS